MTEHVRMHYIKQQIERGLMASNALQDIHVMSLQASYDPGQPLYFWQLFSLLGQARIEKLVRSFYTKVFNDTENAWFREPFSNVGGLQHHTDTQSAMWIDTMGGGSYYHGGDFRLQFHHQHNALSIMTLEGATRWLYHMRITLNECVLFSLEDCQKENIIFPEVRDYFEFKCKQSLKDFINF
eukprot:PhF_6_TR42695/c0_g1_i2/m.64432